MRAILDASDPSNSSHYIVSDPFSGGCTVALEAYLRGNHAFAQDLNPWPITALQIALNDAQPEAFWEAGKGLLNDLRAGNSLYNTRCEEHEETELLTALWVREVSCPKCHSPIYSYPYGLATVASRKKGESVGFFGCTECGDITRGNLNSTRLKCRSCNGPLSAKDTSLMSNRSQNCGSCGFSFKSYDYQKPNWKLALIQRKCQDSDGNRIIHFAYPNEDDLVNAVPGRIPGPLLQTIPDGVETTILRRAGFNTWADMYPGRQLAALLLATHKVNDIGCRQIRDQLLLAICGAAETPGYLARWDRYYPKVFGASDNHRFAPVGLAAEVNPFATQGRGTLSRRIIAARKALEWHRKIRFDKKQMAGTLKFNIGNSSIQPIQSDFVDLVLTDPPYCADVQYGELASPLVAWGQALEIIDDVETSNNEDEAVLNASRGVGIQEFCDNLTRVMNETARTAKQNGKVVLTFHNRDFRAWYALGVALNKAGLWIHAIAPVITETKNDHSKRSTLSFTRDLVIETSKVPRKGPMQIVNQGDSQEARELIAAGKVICHEWSDYQDARSAFLEMLNTQPNWIKTPAKWN
ncbi:MAG: hypothetical protein OXF99_04125 [bacterium]|nr:hypothetical protein [bacterium]